MQTDEVLRRSLGQRAAKRFWCTSGTRRLDPVASGSTRCTSISQGFTHGYYFLSGQMGIAIV
jgi:hypothetical protein